MTQLEKARGNETTFEMEKVAIAEQKPVKFVLSEVAKGHAVIPANILHKTLEPIIIGTKFRTKVNANIGSSPLNASLENELKKLKVAIYYGADTVMDLSIGGNIREIRKNIILNSKVPVGTVPVYEAVVEKNIYSLSEKDFLKAIEMHVKDGVDFITVHAGITSECIPLVEKRKMGIVSRGGSFLMHWMQHHKKENPLFENFDKILKLAQKFDVTLSLGDALRPGCIADSTDKAQLMELKNLGRLTKIAWKENVQVIVEGPGHVPLNEIKKNVDLQKKYCGNAPFYVLGPIVTDVAPGYDHITSAIGGALAGMFGAAFLCYVTPAEHLRLPDLDDVREGVIATRIAAHAADVAKGLKQEIEWDNRMTKYRSKLDWQGMIETAIDSKKAYFYRKQSKVSADYCSMCGKYCTLKGFK